MCITLSLETTTRDRIVTEIRYSGSLSSPVYLIPNETPQGTLIVSLRNSASGQPIDDNEVRRKFQQFGDVKSVTPGERNDERNVEFYDMRVGHYSLLALKCWH